MFRHISVYLRFVSSGETGRSRGVDSVVIISSNRFRKQTGEIGGKAWDSLCKKNPHLENQRDDFKEVIVSGKESHHRTKPT